MKRSKNNTYKSVFMTRFEKGIWSCVFSATYYSLKTANSLVELIPEQQHGTSFLKAVYFNKHNY